MNEILPIVFIHGLFQVPYTIHLSKFLSPTPVIIPDLPGYGANVDLPIGIISLSTAADFVYDCICFAKYEKVHLVGHSVGGAVAVILADQHPEVVASIISVEGNFTLKDAFWSQKVANMSENEVSDLVAAYRADPDGWLTSLGVEITPERRVIAARILAAQPATTLQAMARSVVQITGKQNYLQAINTIIERGIPFHLVAGEKSFKEWDIPEWVKATSVTIQPGVGHMLMLEDELGFISIIKQIV